MYVTLSSGSNQKGFWCAHPDDALQRFAMSCIILRSCLLAVHISGNFEKIFKPWIAFRSLYVLRECIPFHAKYFLK